MLEHLYQVQGKWVVEKYRNKVQFVNCCVIVILHHSRGLYPLVYIGYSTSICIMSAKLCYKARVHNLGVLN